MFVNGHLPFRDFLNVDPYRLIQFFVGNLVAFTMVPYMPSSEIRNGFNDNFSRENQEANNYFIGGPRWLSV